MHVPVSTRRLTRLSYASIIRNIPEKLDSAMSADGWERFGGISECTVLVLRDGTDKGLMAMMIVVVARDEQTQKAIASALKAEGCAVTPLSSLGALPEVLKNVPVSGILIELITSTKSSMAEKQATNDLIQLYTNARFKFVDNQVRILGHGMSLEQFVGDCRMARPRTSGKKIRKVRHIALLLSADAELSSAEKTVTIDISAEGCFVFSSREWSIGDRVWLRLLDNECVLTGTVRSWQPWGNNKKMPGIGVQLDFSETPLE